MRRKKSKKSKIKIFSAILIAVGFVFICVSCDKSEKSTASPLEKIINGIKKQLPSFKDKEEDDDSVVKKSYKRPDALIDREMGALQKVIIKSDNAYASNEPGGASNGKKLPLYFCYYIFDKQDMDGETFMKGKTYYEVGDTSWKESIKGWVDAENCVYWPTKLGVRVIRPENSENRRILIFQSKEDLIRHLRGEDVKSIAATEYDYNYQPFMAWPTLLTENVKIGDRMYELDKIAVLAKVSKNTTLSVQHIEPSLSKQDKEKQREILSGVKMLDVVFVIDSTKSMGPYILEAKKAAISVADKLRNCEYQPDIMFGLVEYRDFVDQIGFPKDGSMLPYKVYSLAKFDDFYRNIREVREAKISSDNYPEAVLEGLDAAIHRIGWRGKNLSERLIILIGDNSCKQRPVATNGHVHQFTVDDIVAAANQKDKHIKIFSMLAPNKSDADIEKHRSEFTQLAKNTGGDAFSLESESLLVNKIKTVVFKGCKVVENRDNTAQEIADHELFSEAESWNEVREAIKIQSKEDYNRYTEVVTLLEDAGYSLKDLRPGDIVFKTGWISIVDPYDNVEVVQREVYMSASQVRALARNLDWLSEYLLIPSYRERLAFLASIVRKEGGAGYFLTDQTGLDMDIFLKINHLACAKSSILNFDMSYINQLSHDAAENLCKRIFEKIGPLRMECNYQDRFPHTDMTSPGWVREELLP